MLDWQENLGKDEMPPEWMWPLDDEIIQWMDNVIEDRKAKSGGDYDDGDKPSGPMMKNEYAQGRR